MKFPNKPSDVAGQMDNADDLQQMANFVVRMWPNPDWAPQDYLKEWTYELREDPPPGITPIDAEALSADIDHPIDGLISVTIRTSVENYIRWSIEFDVDPYRVLQDVKKAAGPEMAAVAHEFMSDPNSGLRVARIGGNSKTGITSDNWPASVNL